MCEVRFIASLDSNSLMTIDTVHNFHVLFGQFVRHLCEMPMEFLHPLKKKIKAVLIFAVTVFIYCRPTRGRFSLIDLEF